MPVLSSTSLSYAVVPKGTEHIVKCNSNTRPKPTVTWKRDGVIVDPENDPRYELLLPNYDLRIPAADEDTAGKYRCILRNKDGVYEIGWDLNLIVGCKSLLFFILILIIIMNMNLKQFFLLSKKGLRKPSISKLLCMHSYL